MAPIVVVTRRALAPPRVTIALLMSAISRPVRFVCHHYISKVPLLQQAVALMGAFPLEADQRRQASFFRQSASFLQANQVVGVFPEGAAPCLYTCKGITTTVCFFAGHGRQWCAAATTGCWTQHWL